MKEQKKGTSGKGLKAKANESVQQWTLLNPEGVIHVEVMKLNPHPVSLEGKTVMLRANGKHNSGTFLDRMAELLEKEVKGIQILKSWSLAPESNVLSHSPDRSRQIAETLAKFKPDLVIASNAD